MASKTVTSSIIYIKYKQKLTSFWYRCYVLLKQNPFPSMHPACSSLVHLTAIILTLYLCCYAVWQTPEGSISSLAVGKVTQRLGVESGEAMQAAGRTM